MTSRFLLPRRRRDVTELLIAAAALILTALPIEASRVSSFERTVFHVLNRLTDAVYWPLWAVMQCGQLLAVPVAVIAALVARRVRLAVDLLLAGTAAYVLAKVVKVLVFRERPGELLSDVILRHAPAGGHGYVAGHAATAFALAGAAFPYLGARSRWIVVAIATVVGLGRVYVGAHLPLDVIGGAALGWGCASLVHVLLGSPERRATTTGSEAAAQVVTP